GPSGGGSGGGASSGSSGASSSSGSSGGLPDGGFVSTPDGGSPCISPTTVSAAQVQDAYTTWKTQFVTSSGIDGGSALRVQDPNDTTNPNRTVSEGIGYGMIIAAYMADRALFDALWAYEQAHLDSNGIMNWLITAAGTTAGRGGATDADEDIAWALLIADKQWPGNGYIDLAKKQIGLLLSLEINATTSLLKWGDLSTNATTVHPDYFSPAYYRVFGSVTGNTAAWNAVISAGYALLRTARNATTGLVPDLCTVSGTPTGNPADAVYGYDACRTPWRVGIDWCFNASADALSVVAPMAAYFAGVGAPLIKGPVALDGTTSSAVTAYQNPEFTGPAGVAGMADPTYQSFLDAAWARTYALVQQSQTSPNYFGASVGLISMLVMGGQFVSGAP
ncbi:MAG TPA: glycosyl hydrolase family 8, partial [Polyangiaceae bacterium]|nr:glycosyl hydrolase family 8 [Polyangiaceae bacterium]